VKCNGKTTARPGLKGSFSEEELNTLEVAILSFLALSQANCHKEIKDNIISVVQNIVQNVGVERSLKDAASFWRRMQGRLASHLDLDTESNIEMRRQFWMRYPNISLWYDGWEKFVLSRGFATKSDDGSVTSRRI
jgi:hypothetical protein